VETCGRRAATDAYLQPGQPTAACRGPGGEIGTRGALLMLGYFDDQAATEESFNRDGWFRPATWAR
jgi:acyl-CoA synthetase